MNPRDPLTLRIARTERETERDPYSWWEGPIPMDTHRKRKPSVIPTEPPLWVRVLRAVVNLWKRT